ncbi:DUF4258 domain-containing protein [Myroides odoratimimus]|uniref:Uncharacterized protein n=3 Tax=Myroides odoratimimus TaxID=76832 RepID=A0A0S7EED1_9FLAO|nr:MULTISPECIES: DUF4258 domain-containing protein [Myroides]AJA69837.1 Protein of unknown function DUF4258 [Myroides sp. A21]ALU27089.1 hypothetical protein AS202_13410 [Myroides odoratimimus]APA93112.1 hypothetical protein BK054_12960 [Myroides sp. ZB35]EHO08568.1 hypothetical protein HMPREF9712_02230 [Myroides odoratimimus CCUG 10230]EHO09956.1 hypothetical protein HMPREF9714_01641 [Myroides odoratimimus CCUG 12901]
MKFTQRLAYYLFGLLIGGMFLFYFFGEKKTEFCYLPNCRVLKDLRSKPVTYSKTVEAKFKEGWVSNDDIRKSLQYGDVNFSESNIDFEKGKLYVIIGRNEQNENILIKVINYTDKIVLYDIEKM